MKRRLAIEWLVLVACCIVGLFVKPMIDPPLNAVGLVLGIPLYVAVGIVRLTVAAIRYLTPR